MSEIKHPPIHLDSPIETTIQEDFADRAYEVLAAYMVGCTESYGNFAVTYPVTDRVDLISTDDNLEVAVRLIRHPAFVLSGSETSLSVGGCDFTYESPSGGEYMAIGLQYGTRNEDEMEPEEPIVDEDFDWQSYVLVVVHPEANEVSLLDATTGKDLETPDIMHAQVLLEMMARELSGIACQDAMHGYDEIPLVTEKLRPSWEDLKSWDEFYPEESEHPN